MKDKKIMKFLGYPIVILDVIIYFVLSYVFVDGFQNNIIANLVNGALLFIGAMIATSAMLHQGLLSGGETRKFQETLEAHIKQKQKIYSKLSKLQHWLDHNYQDLLEIGRSVYINSAGYEYNEVFTSNGKFISGFKIPKPKPLEYKKWYQKIVIPFLKLSRWMFSDDWNVYRERKRNIRRARRYRISRLTVSDLMNIDADKDPNNFGITEKQYISKQMGSSVITRLMFSCFLPCISWGFIGFNITTFITQMVNIVLILLTALFSMFCAYFFKVKTQRNSIIKKINKMEEFDNTPLNILEKLIVTDKEEDHEVHAKVPILTPCNVVEEIHEQCEHREEDSVCDNADTRV